MIEDKDYIFWEGLDGQRIVLHLDCAKYLASGLLNDYINYCHTLKSNMGRLTYQDRRSILEALKIRVHTGEAIRIEGVLPVTSTVQEDIELTPLRGGPRG